MLNGNKDIEYFRKYVVRKEKMTTLHTSPGLSQRNKWVKQTAGEVFLSTCNLTANSKENNSKHQKLKSVSGIEKQKYYETVELVQEHIKKSGQKILAQVQNKEHQKLSILQFPDCQKESPACDTLQTLKSMIRSEQQQQLKPKNSAAVSHLNYYQPISEHFTKAMSTKFNQAMRSLETSRMSFQQAIANQRNNKTKDEREKTTTSCIDPPTPKTNGEWTEVHNKPVTKKNTKPPEIEIFPKQYP